MSRVLIVEPDGPGRMLMGRVLVTAGHMTEAVEAVGHAKLLLDDEAFDVALVDEAAGRTAPLEDVRWLRENYPRVPVIVTGSVLSQRAMVALLRLGVVDAVSKPFTPEQLRDAVGRALARAAPGHARSLDFAAAMHAARAALAEGRPRDATAPLARLHALLPLDAESMALEALHAEVEGRDVDADRAYRAALALGLDPAAEPPEPHEGIARVASYPSDAKIVASIPSAFAHAPVWLVTDAGDDAVSVLSTRGPHVVLHALGLADPGDPDPARYVRANAHCAIVVSMGPATPEALARVLAPLTDGALHMAEGARIDIARVETLRREKCGMLQATE